VYNNGTYYRDAYAAETATELRRALATAISANYQRYSYSCVWDMAGDADSDPANANNVILFYTGQSWPKTVRDNGSNDEGWNREHVWPKSHGFPSEGDEPYTDGHHLTACDKWVNNRRSDKDFGNGGTPLCLLPLDNPLSNCDVAGATSSTTFEVCAEAGGPFSSASRA
jgi:serine protease